MSLHWLRAPLSYQETRSAAAFTKWPSPGRNDVQGISSVGVNNATDAMLKYEFNSR